jgi:hypothetical protein
MKFQLLDKIEKVNFYLNFSNSYVFRNINHEIYFDNIKIDENVYDDLYYNDNKLIYNKDRKIYIYDILKGSFHKIDNYELLKSYNFLTKNKVIIDNNEKLSIFDENEKITLLNTITYNWGQIIIFENNIIIIDNTQIHAYTLPAAQPLWQFDLGVLGTYQDSNRETHAYEVWKFLGVWENLLLVQLHNETVVALDIETGKLKNQWHTYTPQSMDEYTTSTLGKCMKIDYNRNKLVGFNFFVIWELDLLTNNLVSYNLQETYKQYDVFSITNVSSFAQNETHFFITANTTFKTEINKFNDVLMAINKETRVIDWIHYFKDNEWLAVNVPQISENKLYQLDSANTLHIFQKENPSI